MAILNPRCSLNSTRDGSPKAKGVGCKKNPSSVCLPESAEISTATRNISPSSWCAFFKPAVAGLWPKQYPPSKVSARVRRKQLLPAVGIIPPRRALIGIWSDVPIIRCGEEVMSTARKSLTPELTHAGPKDAARGAELRRPSGVVCREFVRHHVHSHTPVSAGGRFSADTTATSKRIMTGILKINHRSELPTKNAA